MKRSLDPQRFLVRQPQPSPHTLSFSCVLSHQSAITASIDQALVARRRLAALRSWGVGAGWSKLEQRKRDIILWRPTLMVLAQGRLQLIDHLGRFEVE